MEDYIDVIRVIEEIEDELPEREDAVNTSPCYWDKDLYDVEEV